MRFMMVMIPKGYADAKADAMPSAEAIEAMGKYNDELQKAGVLLGMEGLYPPAAGVRVSFGSGKPTVTDGPFAESKELIGGYWMVDFKSQAEAVEWATRCPASEGDIIEIRQVHEIEDFEPSEAITREAALREELARKK